MSRLLLSALATIFFFVASATCAQKFQVTTLDESVGGFAVFNSNSHLVTRNERGTFVSYLKDATPSYTAQWLRIVRVGRDGSADLTLLDEVVGGPPACLASSRQGELFAVSSDLSAMQLRVFKWQDPGQGGVQRASIVDPMVGFNGKFSCVLDEGRRSLFFAGHSGQLISISARTLAMNWVTPLFKPTAVAQPEYPNLQWSPDTGVVDLATTTFYTGPKTPPFHPEAPDDPHYWTISTLWSPNNFNDVLVLGYVQVPLLPAPSDDTFAGTITSSDLRYTNKLLGSFLVDGVNLYYSLWVGAASSPQQRCLGALADCNVMFMHILRDGSRPSVYRPLVTRDGRAPKPSGGGMLVKRGRSIYFIDCDPSRSELVAYRFDPDGWRFVTSQAVSSENEPSCLYMLSGDKGWPDDEDVVGVFTLLRVSCETWATSGGPTTPARLMFFRFTP